MVAIIIQGCQPEVNIQTQDPPNVPQEQPEPSSPITISTSSSADYDEHLSIRNAPERDLYKIASRLKPSSKKFIGKITAAPPLAKLGDKQIFPLFNDTTNDKYNITAALKFITPSAYWYFEQNTSIDPVKLEETSKTFEEQILPIIVATFGSIWPLETTGNLRITILHAPLSGKIGYYTSINEHPVEIHESSIERKVIYLNSVNLKLGSPEYLAILSHELQHMIHWNHDPTEESWINEGLSELAADIAGFPNNQIARFSSDPSTQLNAWNHNPKAAAYHYGASYLFFRYLLDRYITTDDIKTLVKEPTDGIPGLETALEKLGQNTSFDEIFGRWVVANLINSETISELGYNQNATPRQSFKKISPQKLIKTFGTYPSSVPQYAADYIRITLDDDAASITFRGRTATTIFPAELPIGTHCWWSNQGDSIDSHLTRTVDLTNAQSATLAFTAWFDIENDWDYAYVMISEDDGASWTILKGLHSVDKNPTGNSYGPAYTGKSAGWIKDRFDLSSYAGQKILLRFEYITDEAYHSHGICLDNISIPEIGFFDDAESLDSWTANGFIRTNNISPQEYIVQIVEITNGEAKIRQIALDALNNATVFIRNLRDTAKDTYLVVSPINPYSRETADYTLTVGKAPTP